MRITTQAWETYIRRLAQLNEKAAQLMAEYLAAHGIADTEALTDYAAALVQKYGEGSAELACQMYDAMAALQNARVSPAEPAAPASRREVARMVQATRESPPQMQRGVSRLVKRAGADTTLKNAQRDGAEFAWVPHGDSCAFCLTLASRGWQRASQAAIKGGHAEHIHASCDCEYAVRFDGRTSVAGYDPEAYVWGGSTPETSFDCSGFVSYVLTNSGLYNTGRLGAQGLYNISTRVSNPQPGDLVFFTGTYDTPGVSHVGIYVGEDGDGSPVMLHCGDPIQYTKLDTSYWQSHFYAYGRLHYN